MMKLLNSVLCTNYYAWLAGNTELSTNLCLHILSRRKELMLMIVNQSNLEGKVLFST